LRRTELLDPRPEQVDLVQLEKDRDDTDARQHRRIDHTLREAYRDRGLDDAAREALPNVCVRCLGLGDGEFPVTSFEVARGGAVVLLSRGVHQALAEARLAAALTRERARGGDSSWAARAAAALVAEATDPSAWGDATALVLAR
jgi:serine/threonine protein phosphatase PrpC